MRARLVTLARGLLGVVVALALLELLVRQVFVLSVVDEPGYGPITEPGSTVVWRREGHGVSHWIAHGIRRPLRPMDPRPPVLVVGDSQTEALMVDDDEVCTALADGRLQGGSWAAPAVLNAGRASASLADYVVHAERFTRLFSPAWVVLVLQENDLGSDSYDPGKTHFVIGEGGALEARFVPPRPRRGLDARLWDLRQRSMLVAYTYVRLGELRKAAEAEPPLFRAGSTSRPARTSTPDYPIGAELSLANAAYRGRVSFFLLSTFDFHAPGVASPVERRFLAECAAAGLHCATPRATYPAIAMSGQAPYGHSNSAFNFGHLNRVGHRAVGAALAEHLQDLHEHGLL
jgi:hypothetical protein